MVACHYKSVSYLFLPVNLDHTWLEQYSLFLLMYRCLRLYKFHLTAWFIDDFLGTFLIAAIMILSAVLVCIKYHLGLMANITLKALTCIDMKVVEFKDDL